MAKLFRKKLLIIRKCYRKIKKHKLIVIAVIFVFSTFVGIWLLKRSDPNRGVVIRRKGKGKLLPKSKKMIDFYKTTLK